MKPERKRKIQFQLMVFVFLILLVEVVLRLFGMRAGTLIDDFDPNHEAIYRARFYSDEAGINHILGNSKELITGSIINGQGFRGSFDYTPQAVDSIRKNSRKKVVMIIGDSYVEGCCPDNVANSFPDLINRNPEFAVLNFGVAGTDPLQYELVARKYVPLLRPDIVVIAFYFGNDILFFDRKPTPGIPITYPFKKNKWIYSIAPDYLSKEQGYVFKNEKEAFRFYLNHYTLMGDNRNFCEKMIRRSLVLSKIYLLIENRMAKWKWGRGSKIPVVDGNKKSNDNLNAIANVCDSVNVSYLFAGIPSPGEALEAKGLAKKYKQIFEGFEYYIPDNLTLQDYDGGGIENHFNNNGHKKYAIFLLNILTTKKQLPQRNKVK